MNKTFRNYYFKLNEVDSARCKINNYLSKRYKIALPNRCFLIYCDFTSIYLQLIIQTGVKDDFC